jgi:hypothetical protein
METFQSKVYPSEESEFPFCSFLNNRIDLWVDSGHKIRQITRTIIIREEIGEIGMGHTYIFSLSPGTNSISNLKIEENIWDGFR